MFTAYAALDTQDDLSLQLSALLGEHGTQPRRQAGQPPGLCALLGGGAVVVCHLAAGTGASIFISSVVIGSVLLTKPSQETLHLRVRKQVLPAPPPPALVPGHI